MFSFLFQIVFNESRCGNMWSANLFFLFGDVVGVKVVTVARSE